MPTPRKMRITGTQIQRQKKVCQPCFLSIYGERILRLRGRTRNFLSLERKKGAGVDFLCTFYLIEEGTE